MAHAPEHMQLRRELVSVALPTEGVTDPIERAKDRVENGLWAASQFLADGFAEAKEIEAEIRAGRPPPAAPLLSDEERMQRAKAALGPGRPP